MGEMNILLGFFLGWGTSGAPEERLEIHRSWSP
jgi:hypothetical protein